MRITSFLLGMSFSQLPWKTVVVQLRCDKYVFSQSSDLEVLDLASASPAVIDAHDVHFDAVSAEKYRISNHA